MHSVTVKQNQGIRASTKAQAQTLFHTQTPDIALILHPFNQLLQFKHLSLQLILSNLTQNNSHRLVVKGDAPAFGTFVFSYS
jgi:hypothetical protein